MTIQRSGSFREFRGRFEEVRCVIKSAERLPTGDARLTTSKLHTNTIYARAAIVLLVSHLQGYFNELAREVMSVVGANWSHLSTGHSRALAIGAARELLQEAGKLYERNFDAPSDIGSFKKVVGQINIGMANPKRLPQGVREASLEGFFVDSAPKSIDKHMKRLDPQGRKFFDWVAEQGGNRGMLWTTLENVTQIRNDIAHGNLDAQPTLLDSKQMTRTCVELVKFADKFACEGYPDLPYY